MTEHGNHVTSDQFKPSLAEVGAKIGGSTRQFSMEGVGVRTRDCDLLKPGACAGMVGAVVATATMTVGIVRFIG